jgi:hypothetical protein
MYWTEHTPLVSYQVLVGLVPYAFASKLACDCTPCVKGIVSRNEYFLKAYNNKKVLSVHALI